MRLERTRTGFQSDSADLGPLLGVAPGDAQRLIREGRINILNEKGEGEDGGRHRIDFRYDATRVRLTVNNAGEVLLRSRTTVVSKSDSE